MNILNIFSLMLNLLGTIFLAVPLIRSKKNSDDHLVTLKQGSPKKGEDDSKYYTTAGFLKDKKMALRGLFFLGAGIFIQFIVALGGLNLEKIIFLIKRLLCL